MTMPASAAAAAPALRKEYLSYDAVIYCLQNFYDDFLEYNSLTNEQVMEMNKTELEIFWDEYEIYTFGPLNYIGSIEMPNEKSIINAKINMGYNKGINICDYNYVFNSQLLNYMYAWFWNSTQKQYIQILLLEPKLELK
jgi:uncharacterized membrane protein